MAVDEPVAAGGSKELRTERLAADEAAVARAAGLLAAGQLVAFPTDTVYGLGASVEHPEAVAALYRVKGRPADKPFALLVSDIDSAQRYARSWPAQAERLAAAFWPGPLTIIVPRVPSLPEIVVAGGDTVALRVPGHPIARALAQQLGAAIAAPSANLSGEPPPADADAVMAQLAGRIPLLLDSGPCQHGQASTIVAIGEQGALTVLREGAVSHEALSEYVPLAVG